MGICLTKLEKEDIAASKAIDKSLISDHKLANADIKMLLLGAGGSGKSTVLKQMKIIHNNGFSTNERIMSKDAIFNNIITAMKAILLRMSISGLEFQVQGQLKNKGIVERVGFFLEPGRPSDEILSAIYGLWNDQAVKQCAANNLDESAQYFFDRLDRIAQPNYIPSDDDILHCRVRTLGVLQTTFNLHARNFHMFDVGGQRSERRTASLLLNDIKCFDAVNAVIFVASMSDYDAYLFDDPNTRCMDEALNIFKEIANSKWFCETPMILFLNKKDLFEEKLKLSPLSDIFPDFDGGEDFHKASEFLKWQFIALNGSIKRQVFPHFTCATDKDAMRFVMDSVIQIVITANLEGLGLM